MIEASAPGRFGVAGNPSDMYGGAVISCSTLERAGCRIDTESDGVVVCLGDCEETIRFRSDLDLTGGPLDLPKAALTAAHIDPVSTPGFRLDAFTDIPRQSGLAGSTALFAAILGALNDFLGRRTNPYRIAETVRAAEFDIMKTLCGFQDAYMVVFGGMHFMDFRGKSVKCNSADQSPYATMEPLHAFQPDGIPVLVAFTGVMHHSGQAHASLFDRYSSGDPEARCAAEEFANYARFAKRAILDREWDQLARYMNLNQELIRKVQPQNPANEKLIDAAMSAGALAAKLAGAGGGGSIAVLTEEPDRVAPVLKRAGASSILTPRPCPGLTIARRD